MVREKLESLDLVRSLGLGRATKSGVARMREAAGAQLSNDFWQWVTDQWSAEILVEQQQELFLTERNRRRGGETGGAEEGEAAAAAAAGGGDESAAASAASDTARDDDGATDGIVKQRQRRGLAAAPPLCLPWHDTAAAAHAHAHAHTHGDDDVKPWSGVASRVVLPLGAVRISSVEHAGSSFEDLLRPLAAVAAAAAAAEEKATEKAESPLFTPKWQQPQLDTVSLLSPSMSDRPYKITRTYLGQACLLKA